MSENKKEKKSNFNLRTTLLMVSAFLIGFGSGAVCITLVDNGNNNVPVFQNVDSQSASNGNNGLNQDNISSVEPISTTLQDNQVTEVTTVTTVPTTTTTEVTTTTTPANLPTPLSGEYTDMVVEKVPYKEDISGDKVVYLTFDDGPWSGTPEVLDLLDEYDVKATFFVTAQFFENEDDLINAIKQLHDRGHEVCVHTYSHEYHDIYNSVSDYLDDYKKMDDIILKATGERSHVFRFPGGSNNVYGKHIREDLIREMNSRGFVYQDWNAYDGGCDGYSIDSMIYSAVNECISQDKSILLMHDTKAQSFILDTLPSIISQIKDAGYRFDVLDGTVKPIQFATVDDEEDEEQTDVTTTPEYEDDEYSNDEEITNNETYDDENLDNSQNDTDDYDYVDTSEDY
ncbi:MAG: polysaccharide deacetylase family protein [Oscillospiraceae bacterium]